MSTQGATKVSKEGSDDEVPARISTEFMMKLMTGIQTAITTALASQHPGTITGSNMNQIIVSLRPPNTGTGTPPTPTPGSTAPIHTPIFSATPGKANSSHFINYETT